MLTDIIVPAAHANLGSSVRRCVPSGDVVCAHAHAPMTALGAACIVVGLAMVVGAFAVAAWYTTRRDYYNLHR